MNICGACSMSCMYLAMQAIYFDAAQVTSVLWKIQIETNVKRIGFELTKFGNPA